MSLAPLEPSNIPLAQLKTQTHQPTSIRLTRLYAVVHVYASKESWQRPGQHRVPQICLQKSNLNISQLPVKQQLRSGSLWVLTQLRTYSWYSMPIALAHATLFLPFLPRMHVREMM